MRGDRETREMKKIHSHHGGAHNALDQLDQEENASLCTRRVTLSQRAGRSRGFFLVFPLSHNSSPKA